MFAWLEPGLLYQDSLVVPALMSTLQNTNTDRGSAARALGTIGENARPAVPILLKLLNDPDQSARREATDALSRIAPVTQTNSIAH